MSNDCPVCDSQLQSKKGLGDRDATKFECPLCGSFVMPNSLVACLPDIRTQKDSSAKISHAISRMQRGDKDPELNSDTVNEIIKTPLPTPTEQKDLLIRWLAERTEGPGEMVDVKPDTHRSIIGAKSNDGFALILKHLFDTGLVTGTKFETLDGFIQANLALSIPGWEYYQKLQQGAARHRKAFMAMKFGDQELNYIVEHVFKPAIRQTGFDLYLISDDPKAGLIDDKIRAEIQASDFVIADLTHDNLGAYWEAGYAEGLGKPVIYTCEKSKFEKEKTHFDTNHHLTIIWSSDNPNQAGESLKATVRATLPHMAKQGN